LAHCFSNVFANGSPNFPPSSASVTGGLEEFFLSDKFKIATWLTFIVGLRQSHFTADIVENDVDPRLGLAIKVPRIKWVIHAFYGHFYQPPPLITATGPLLNLANSQNLTFASLRGERDEEYQFGVTNPFAVGRWTPTISKPPHKIGSITATSVNPACSGRSPGIKH
jgi:hypothetical protein